jgi:hypothetical protein
MEQCIAPRPDTGRVVRRAGDPRTASRLFNPDSLSRLVLALAQRAVTLRHPVSYHHSALRSWRLSYCRHDHESSRSPGFRYIVFISPPTPNAPGRCYFPASAIVPRSRLHLTTDAFVSFRPLSSAQSPTSGRDATNGCLILHPLCDPAICGVPLLSVS